MPKTTLFTFIILTSLVIMACSFSGLVQQKIETQPTVIEEAALPTEEILTPLDSPGANQVEPTVQIKPTPTIDPLQAAQSCLAKKWEIHGLSDYVVAAVPPELAQEYNLQYVETTGQAFLTLSPDGKIVLQAEKLAFLFTAQFAVFEVPVTVNIDGSATGTYALDRDTLTVKDMDTSSLTASAQALNEDLMDSDQIIAAIPFVRPPFNTAKYTCQGEVLELQLSGYPADLPPLVFQAVE